MFSSTTLLFIRTLAALGAVCLAAWVLLRWGLPRWLPHLSAGDSDDGPIDVLARHPVGSKSAILLVRVDDHTLVVGEAEAGLSRLGEIPSKRSSGGGSNGARPTVELDASDIVESIPQRSPSSSKRCGPTPTPRGQPSGALPIVELGESGLGDSVRRSRSSTRPGQARQSPSPVSVVEPVDPSEIQTTQETAAPASGDLPDYVRAEKAAGAEPDPCGTEATSSESARARVATAAEEGGRGRPGAAGDLLDVDRTEEAAGAEPDARGGWSGGLGPERVSGLSSRRVVNLRKSDKKRGQE